VPSTEKVRGGKSVVLFPPPPPSPDQPIEAVIEFLNALDMVVVVY
jgi:hypothetical protein